MVAIFFLSNRRSFWFENIVGRFKRVKAFDVELELTEKAALQVRELTQDAFSEWRKRIQTEFDRKVYASPVTESIRLVTDNVKDYLRGYGIRDLRATVHVPDPLFADMLYQLTDYYPAQKSGGGRGRIMSERFGIVGLAWRSRETKVRHDVPTDQSQLVEHWGMNLDEAGSAGSGRQSFFAEILKDENHRAIGVFYMDATDKDVFRKANTQDTVTLAVERYGLADAVKQLSDELNKRGPIIKLTDLS
ncbi:hypothetical protein [Mycobacterium avium]|uniref:hypothetical protein n=1 Tax=Mycobacterium avium TaxID=1764 RepID=UPI00124A73C0|nr:hypothetical protein [Mycobacterium avium]